MPNILETEMVITDIKDTTTTVKSEKEEKIKDHEQIRAITAKTVDTVNGVLKIVITGDPQVLQHFTLDDITIKISSIQTQLQTGEEDND